MILSTLREEDRSFVSFDKDGKIDKPRINQQNSLSINLKKLLALVNDFRTFDVIIDNRFTYKNEKEEVKTEKLSSITINSGLSPFGKATVF